MFLSLIMILARILEYKANRIIFVRSRKLTIYELFRKNRHATPFLNTFFVTII